LTTITETRSAIAGWLVNTMGSSNWKKLEKVRVIDFSKGYQANSLLT
jgi:hypothetical protein